MRLPRSLLTARPIRRGRVGFVTLTPLWRDIDRLQRLIRHPAWRSLPAGYGCASVQNASDPSAFFDVERSSRRRRQSNNSLMSLSLHPSGCHSAVHVRFAPIPTVRGVAGKIVRAFGALFASLSSGMAMAHWLVASHEAGGRRAIDLLAPYHRAYHVDSVHPGFLVLRPMTHD